MTPPTGSISPISSVNTDATRQQHNGRISHGFRAVSGFLEFVTDVRYARRLRRGPSVRVSLTTGFVGTIIIVLIGIAGPYLERATTTQQPVADPGFVAARSAPTAPADSAPPPPAIDERGFVNSFARCDGPQSVVALGRTEGSEVAICAAADGQYVYKGVRLSRGTTLGLGGVTLTPNGFEARNDGVVYNVSPTELVISDGSTVLSREPMVAYQNR